MNSKEREIVAYHECGHAIVASLVATGDPVSKISIIPRSRGSLGYTMQMPKEDRYLLSIEELHDQLARQLAVARPHLRVLYMPATRRRDRPAWSARTGPGVPAKALSADTLARRIREVLAAKSPPIV
jgi:hypothetical protein